VVAAVLGGLFVLATSGSVLQTLVTPGTRVGRPFKMINRAIDRVIRLAGRAFPTYLERYRLLAFQAPLTLAALLISALTAYLVGFGLMLWPATKDLPAALRESGSSLFTLGFASTRGGGPAVVDFVAGATGLIIVALQIAYLPTLYSAFNRRETEVMLFGVRGGLPAWGPELLARTRFTITLEELPAFYRAWERWSAEVAESHSSYPILALFRSPDPLASWLISLLAVLDSAALYWSLSPEEAPREARLCLAMGFRCLRQLARTIGIPYDEDPHPDAGIALTREEFDEGIARLQSVDFRMERTPDEAWRHFQGWRVNYESIAYRLAYSIDAVPAAWSGPRRSGEVPLPTRKVINRTPEAPQGAPPTYPGAR
jgi:hypothetical protein